MNKRKTYRTQSLNLAAALHSKGCTLLDYEHSSFENKVIFIFDHYQDCEKYEKQWFANSLQVMAYDYALSLRLLKGVLYERDRNK